MERYVELAQQMQKILVEEADRDVFAALGYLIVGMLNKEKAPPSPEQRVWRTKAGQEFTEVSRITYVQPNPKRYKTACYERYKLHKTGQTVGDYMNACVEQGLCNRTQARGDIKWDLRHGFITLA
jgi:hypothetical protein